jgi:hypothetical protein
VKQLGLSVSARNVTVKAMILLKKCKSVWKIPLFLEVHINGIFCAKTFPVFEKLIHIIIMYVFGFREMYYKNVHTLLCNLRTLFTEHSKKGL